MCACLCVCVCVCVCVRLCVYVCLLPVAILQRKRQHERMAQQAEQQLQRPRTLSCSFICLRVCLFVLFIIVFVRIISSPHQRSRTLLPGNHICRCNLRTRRAHTHTARKCIVNHSQQNFWASLQQQNTLEVQRHTSAVAGAFRLGHLPERVIVQVISDLALHNQKPLASWLCQSIWPAAGGRLRQLIRASIFNFGLEVTDRLP